MARKDQVGHVLGNAVLVRLTGTNTSGTPKIIMAANQTYSMLRNENRRHAVNGGRLGGHITTPLAGNKHRHVPKLRRRSHHMQRRVAQFGIVVVRNNLHGHRSW